MPLYEYVCSSCNATHGLIRPMAKSRLPAPCPQCGKPSPRIMSGPGVIYCNHPTQGKVPGLKPGSMRSLAEQMMLDEQRKDERAKKYGGAALAQERHAREADQKAYAEKKPLTLVMP